MSRVLSHLRSLQPELVLRNLARVGGPAGNRTRWLGHITTARGAISCPRDGTPQDQAASFGRAHGSFRGSGLALGDTAALVKGDRV